MLTAKKSKNSLTRLTLLLSAGFTVMSGAIVAASLPQVREVFAEVNHVELLSRLLLTLHAIFIAVFSPLAGLIADKVGRKKLLIGSLILYGLAGSSVVGLDDLWAILGSRIGLGLAVAGLMTASTTLVADYYQGEERDRFLGWQAAVMSFGGVVFIGLGGWLADIHWRGPFLVYALTLLLIPLAQHSITDLQKPQSKKTVNKRLNRKLRLNLAGLYDPVLFGMSAFYLAPVQVPFLLVELDGATDSTSIGLSLAAMTLTGAITSLLFERIKSKLNVSFLYALAFSALGIGYIIIGFAEIYAVVTVGLLISGIGVGLIMPITNSLVMSLIRGAFRGRAMGWISTFVYGGQFLSPILSQPVIRTFSISWSFSLTGWTVLMLGLGFLIYAVLPTASLLNDKEPL